ncbi:tyrosine protein phosphatase [Saccharomycopsis crataegensis]|uniref:Tyrosine protein phosphatase n=1 Tax=Saccharomycopsis crataegensis TaxID=43959 RepID=A0AAV5QFQ3_9ASCO|nr:tyrosine protein phosphatase [Saccharomycopsis crataegensis]
MFKVVTLCDDDNPISGENLTHPITMSVAEEEKQLSVAFVCSGNICRSTMAEGVFTHMVKQRGLADHFPKIDSFGTNRYHTGDSPDHRTTKVLKKNKISYSHRAQTIKKTDFACFDYLFGMDGYHVSSLNRMKPKDSDCKVMLFGQYNDRSITGLDDEVRDPWYDSDDEGFEECYKQVTYFSKKFLDEQFGA